MAIETHRVAGETKEAAEATKASADATKDAAEAAVREAVAVERQLEVTTQPWLAWTGDTTDGVGVSIYSDDTTGTVGGALRVRNVGNGLALIRVSESRILGGRNRDLEPFVFLKTANPILPPGGETVIRFDVAARSAAWGDLFADIFIGKGVRGNGLFAFDVVYSDSAGAATYRARFQAVPRDPSLAGFIIFQVDYYRGDSAEPIATVRVD